VEKNSSTEEQDRNRWAPAPNAGPDGCADRNERVEREKVARLGREDRLGPACHEKNCRGNRDPQQEVGRSRLSASPLPHGRPPAQWRGEKYCDAGDELDDR